MTAPTIALVGITPDVLSEAIRAAGSTPLTIRERSGYVAALATASVALILVSAADADWRFWATTPKSSPATRRIPVIVLDGDPLEASAAGADEALALAAFLADPAGFIAARARTIDAETDAMLSAGCADPLPEAARIAVALFNAGDFYAQHDHFEALWVAESAPVRDLYRAILQVGVAYHQVTRGNQRGALKMLLRSLQWLRLLPDVCQGVDIAALRADADAVRAELERLGADGIAHFDRALLRPVRLIGDDTTPHSP